MECCSLRTVKSRTSGKDRGDGSAGEEGVEITFSIHTPPFFGPYKEVDPSTYPPVATILLTTCLPTYLPEHNNNRQPIQDSQPARVPIHPELPEEKLSNHPIQKQIQANKILPYYKLPYLPTYIEVCFYPKQY